MMEKNSLETIEKRNPSVELVEPGLFLAKKNQKTVALAKTFMTNYFEFELK